MKPITNKTSKEEWIELNKSKRIQKVIMDNPFENIHLEIFLDQTNTLKVKISEKE